MNRDLLISLVFAGGSPDVAHLTNNKYTIDEYIATADTDEYKIFADEVNKNFLENADLRLLGNLYRCEQALGEVGAKDKNYPHILKAYTDLLKLTGPIVERIQKVKLETNLLDGLEIVIDGRE